MKRHKDKCMVFDVPIKLVSITEDESYQLPKKVNDIVVRGLYRVGGIRGDVVHFESIPIYRNNGVFIFDGIKLCKLDTSIDDYGSLPQQFTPIEEGLPVTYWADCIDHNYIIWIHTSTIRDGMTLYPKIGTIPAVHKHTKHVYCQFTHNKTKYRAIFDPEGEDLALDYQLDKMIKVIYSSKDKYPFNCKSSICSLKNAVFMID